MLLLLVFLAGCVACLIVAIGLIRSGVTPFVVFPKIDSNTVFASMTFPDGTPERVTDQWSKHVEHTFWEVAERLEQEHGEPVAVTTYRVVGELVATGGGANLAAGGTGSHVASVEVELVDTEQREVSSDEIVRAWREKVGSVAGTEQLIFSARSFGPGGTPIEFKILARSEHADQLEAAVERCEERLADYTGVIDIKDDSVPGKWEYRFRIKPEAAVLGVKTTELAETVRAAYYGEEVMRMQRGRHEVKLMVRYPREERRVLANFNEIRVRSDDGVERPITELAEIDIVRGYSEINRVNQMRSITVSADVDEKVANARQIVAHLQREFAPELKREFPDTEIRWEGQQEQTQESLQSLFAGFGVAVLVMYVLLALEFKSYFQPILILLIIPFGMIGAVGGHALLQVPLTLFSMFGIVALTGIVVNDSIVLVDFINARMRAGLPLEQALREAGARRFRPVMLTTVTTIGGLLPILLETSLQAQILIPMAASIAFGEIFATVLVLFLVPVTYSMYWTVLGRHWPDDDAADEGTPKQHAVGMSSIP